MTKICYMMSFARSGETLMLRHLSQSDELQIGYGLTKKETAQGEMLANSLMKDSPKSLSQKQKKSIGLNDNVLVAKTYWVNDSQKSGFVLVRHPLAIVSSVAAKYKPANSVKFSAKIDRICSYVDPSFAQRMNAETSMDMIALKLAVAWSNMMRSAHAMGTPIVHYERFVSDHRTQLEKISRYLGVACTEKLIDAHALYEKDSLGHGGLVLSSEVDPKQAFSKVKHLTEKQKNIVQFITSDVRALYGYDDDLNPSMLDRLCCDRFESATRF